jgi:YidC/Oxa1 family membrane protein insertase
MDTKRLIMAVVLSVVVIIIYQTFFMPKPVPRKKILPKEQQIEQPIPVQKKEPEKRDTTRDISSIFSKSDEKPEEVVQVEKEKPIEKDLKASSEKEVVVESDYYRAVFSNKGAVLRSFELKEYKNDDKQPLNFVSSKVSRISLYFPFSFKSSDEHSNFYDTLNRELFTFQGKSLWNVSGDEERAITFRYADKEKNIYVEKSFVITGNSYVIDLEYRVLKEGKQLDAPFVFGPDLGSNLNEGRPMMMDLKIGAYDGDDIRSINFSRIKTQKTKSEGIEAW